MTKKEEKRERFPECPERVPLRKPPKDVMFLRHEVGSGTYGPHKVEFDVNVNFDCYIVVFDDDSEHGRFTLSVHDLIPNAFQAWVRERAAAGKPVPGAVLPGAPPAPAPPGPETAGEDKRLRELLRRCLEWMEPRDRGDKKDPLLVDLELEIGRGR